MKIELIEVIVQSEEGQQKWIFASTINGREYQSEVILCNLFCEDKNTDYLEAVIESVIKQFEEFEKKLNKR